MPLMALCLCLTSGMMLSAQGDTPERTVSAPPIARPALALSKPTVDDDGVASAAAPADRAVTRKRPNIVMVMADDMRVDDLDFAPHLRRLIGAKGLTFENSFSPYPLCCPARASFLTGVYSHNHHVYWHEDPYGYQAFDDSATIATSLRKAGYRTGFIGKYLNGYGPDISKVSGTPSWKYVPNGWTDWVGAFENPGVKGIHGGTYYYWDTPYNVNGVVDNHYRGRYQTNVMGDFSVRMARANHQSRAPFFMYVSYVAPHHGGPVESDDPVGVRRSDGTDDSLQTPARPDWVKGRFDHAITRPSGLPRNGGPAEADVSDKPSFFRDLSELRRSERASLTEVTRQRAEAVYVLDKQVARLVAELRRTGEWKNTVFMFTSDNGYFLGEHRQRTGKVHAHEPSLRVPFLVTGPGLRTGEKRYDPITTVDITATILDIAGATPPHHADGISRWATMRTGDRGWGTPVVTESSHGLGGRRTGFAPRKRDARTSIGLRTPRYSFSLHRTGESELYDLLTDPAQNRNVYDDPAYRAVRAQLTALWSQYKDCAGATCRAPMPTDLQAGPSEARRLTRHYWNTIDRIYGR